jgi:hypothetical protein
VVGLDLDSEREHVHDGLVQAPHGLRVERARRGLRVHARLVEHLVGDPVADARKEGLVKQKPARKRKERG